MMDRPRSQWHSRGYLPHFEGGERAQFITFRLGDSLPQYILERWRRELERESGVEKEKFLARRVERYLDSGYGEAWLKNPRVAAMIQSVVQGFDGERYKLIAWCIMPNHIHLLIVPAQNYTLTNIMRSLKSFTAHEANKLLNRTGKFWMEDYFDRYIRDANHFAKTVAYIENNPVKAGLCQKASEWKWSSAYAGNADDSSTGNADDSSTGNADDSSAASRWTRMT